MSDEGSEDSAPRPKRKIKRVVVMSSSSGSDSDENIAVAGTRRKRLRVVSDGESDSSGSSVICAGTRRKRTLPKLRDSEGDSDTSGWATDHSDAPNPPPEAAKPASGFASDSSEGNSDKCSICLMRFTNQEVGIPENCEHIFCLDCITEWSKNVNTCPVDRLTFDSIVVRACAAGRVLRTEPVKVVERRPSVEMLVVEDPTVCEICGSSENEESMLLCDGCDLGFHMQCLTPPLTEIPTDQWLCPNCDNILDVIYLSEVDDLFSGTMIDLDLPLSSRSGALRQARNVRRASRNRIDEPSTSSGRRGSGVVDEAPTTSRGTRTGGGARGSVTRRRNGGTTRRKNKRRRAKTVVIEYEVEGNGKFPITKTAKRRIKKRRVKKRQPRTAARQSYVRASVRAKLAALAGAPRAAGAGAGLEAPGLARSPAALPLAQRRARAGIPALSLFGSAHQLDYFSEDERDVSEGAAAAVAARPTSSVLSAYRQARRKMISIPSPTHASSAPDLLSGILESQTLLHSKNSIVEISVDGNVNIKLQSRKRPERSTPAPAGERVDVTKGEDSSRKAPSYPGQSRGGGWGGGYRGNYHRDNGTGGFHSRTYGDPGAPPRPAYPSNGARRDDDNYGNNYTRRSFPCPDEPYDRRFPPRRPEHPAPPGTAGRRSLGGSAWGGPARPLDDPLDMRVQPPPDKPYRPLPEPPVFSFDKPEPARSEDGSDPDLVIDTDKYDPTEPTNDDDEADEPAAPPLPPPPEPPAAPVSPPPASAPAPAPVPPHVLDGAVAAALLEHRALLAPRAPSSDDSDGDCPNFSIYSATSVHIANEGPAPAAAPAPRDRDDLADLVQEDDSPDSTPAPAPAPAPALLVTPPKNKTEEEYKEKVSKRCPITTNPRNPIKIKLNTPSLIKRQVTLYDEEEEEEEPGDDAEAAEKPSDDARGLGDDFEAKAEPAAARTHSGSDKKPTNDIFEDKEQTPPHEEKKLVEAGLTPEASAGGRSDGDDSSPELALDSPRSRDGKDEDDGDGDSNDDISDAELPPAPGPRKDSEDKADEVLEKMTESISETEDERSYTPCLDENKSKDTSLETEKDKGIEGLDTEMISEDEGNEMFSDEGRVSSRASAGASPRASPPRAAAEDGELPEREGTKKKKKKEAKRDSKKETKEKMKGKAKKTEINFKKLSKSGKERNYRDKDKERRDSSDAAEKKRKRKEKRKDLERYDVRTVVTDKRRKVKDAFGRDVSPHRSPSPSPPSPHRDSASPRARLSPGSRRRSPSPRVRRSPSPRVRRSPSPRVRRSPTPRVRRSPSPRARRSPSPRVRRSTSSPGRVRLSLSPRSPSPGRRRRRSQERRRRRSTERTRKRRRSGERSPSRAKSKGKRRRRARSERPASRRAERPRKSPKRRRLRRRESPAPPPAWSPASVDSRLLSPRTPPPEPSPEEGRTPKRRRAERARHRRPPAAAGPSKEVFTSGDNILVSVSFKEQERREAGSPARAARRERRRERRRRRREQEDAAPRPVAIIDLERSPFRELTPSPRNVIVLSDSEQGPSEPPAPAVGGAGAGSGSGSGSGAGAGAAPGPRTPPARSPPPAAAPPALAAPPDDARGPLTPPEPPSSPDAYDPFEPTRSPSPARSLPRAAPTPAPAPAPAPSPPRPSITLETAQKTNLSADDVIDRRPLSPMEKVMALLQSTRDVSPEPPPCAPPPPGSPLAPGPPAAGPAPAARVLLPEVPRPPKLFLAKPSPIKSDPIKPLPAAKPARADSPYSPGSSDFGDLFEPPGARAGPRRDCFDALLDAKRRPKRSAAAKVPVKLNKKKGKTQVGVKIDEDNLRILDELPSSAVEMQVKSKFLKKLNRQERVVEEVKLVLKPHYNKKHVTKDEYKDILRRAVPKICHNKSGEINPTKIQALVEAYVKKFRKKHKLGLA